MFHALTGKICSGENLTQQEMAEAVAAIMAGGLDEGLLAVFLTALHEKGETVEEVAGAAQALRRHMALVEATRKPLVDTCGTGGDGSSTFNISTAAALVAAAAGGAVAKHGNRSVTSKTGSADVLEALGIRIDAPLPVVRRCIDELGFGFCFAPLCHPCLRHAGAVRKRLGFPTIFNLLGPLSNPAGAGYQVLGVGKPRLQRLLAEALSLLGTERAFLVCGGDGLDEVTLSGPTAVLETGPHGVSETVWTPADFGLGESSLTGLQVEGPKQSAEMILQIFSGALGAGRDIVLANASAALVVCGLAPDLRTGVSMGADALDSGRALQLIHKLRELTSANE